MIVNPVKLPRALLLCTLSVVAFAAVHAAGPPGRPIQFGGPDNSPAGTNFNSLATKADSLNPYSQAPREPARNLSNRGSMEGVMVPLRSQQQAKPNKPSNRTRDLLEQRLNWAVMNNEELSQTENEETIAKLRGSAKDEEEQQDEAMRLTPEERLLLNQFEDSQDPRRDPSRRKNDRDKDRRGQDDSISAAMKEREENLQLFLGTGIDTKQPSEFETTLFGSAAQKKARNPGSDFFQLGQGSLPEKSPEQKARMEKFHQILGLPAASDPMQEMLKPRTAPTFSGVQRETFSTPSTLINASPAAAPRESTFGLVPSLSPVTAGNEPSMFPSLIPTLPQNNNKNERFVPPTPSFTAPKRVF